MSSLSISRYIFWIRFALDTSCHHSSRQTSCVLPAWFRWYYDYAVSTEGFSKLHPLGTFTPIVCFPRYISVRRQTLGLRKSVLRSVSMHSLENPANTPSESRRSGHEAKHCDSGFRDHRIIGWWNFVTFANSFRFQRHFAKRISNNFPMKSLDK